MYITSLSVDIQAEYEAEYYVTVDGKPKALYYFATRLLKSAHMDCLLCYMVINDFGI